MSEVLLDRQGIVEAVEVLSNDNDLKQEWMYELKCVLGYRMPSKSPIDALMNLIYAIVLWDEAHAMDWQVGRSHYYITETIKQFSLPINIIEKKDALRRPLFDSDANIYNIYKKTNIPDDSFIHEQMSPTTDNFRYNMARTIDYIEQAKIYQIDYMPSARRNVFAIQLEHVMRRDDILKALDNSLSEFYRQICESSGVTISYDFPVLFDYLLDNSNNGNDIIQGALELKHTHRVKRFRKDVDRMEHALQERNLIKFREYHNSIKEILNEISQETHSSKGIQFSISPMAPFINASANFEITRNPFRFMWLTDLSKYAMTERHRRYGL